MAELRGAWDMQDRVDDPPLSCGVPVVISRWKQRNARQLPSVLWIFATCAPGVAWKRGGPLQTKRAELLRLSFVAFEPTASTCWPSRAPQPPKRQSKQAGNSLFIHRRFLVNAYLAALCTSKSNNDGKASTEFLKLAR